jgi:glycosyltransferase involved in cell wall biosynthesis
MDDLWIVLPHLGAGGAQKVGLLAAEHFAAQGLRVRVLSLRPDHPIKHRLPENVTVLDIGSEVDALHPWLRDGWNRSLRARLRRFTVAQLLKLQRLLMRLLTVAYLGGLRLVSSWVGDVLQPGEGGRLYSWLDRCMAVVGGERYRRLRDLLRTERPKRVLALLSKTNILCCAAAWDLPIHVVVSERNDPRLQRMERLWRWLRCLCYRRADVVTANTDGVLKALQPMGAWTRLELLPNPLPSGVGHTDAKGGLVRNREILAVARLVPQKGLDVLLHSFAQLPQAVRAGWRVTLVGDGPERDRLERMAQTLGLADVVVFEGFRSDPLAFMQRASIFALPSRFEGMPNALLEAMAAGLPAVVTDASPGPLEMVMDQIHGLVVPTDNINCFAEALQCLIQSPELRRRYGEAAQAKLRSLDWSVVEPHWRSVLALPNR